MHRWFACLFQQLGCTLNPIAMFVCKLTKHVYAVPCTDKSNVVDWANIYVHHVVQHEGLATVIISDRGPQLISKFNQALAIRLGEKWKLSTARHPQTDEQKGLTESSRMCCAILYVPTSQTGMSSYVWCSLL